MGDTVKKVEREGKVDDLKKALGDASRKLKRTELELLKERIAHQKCFLENSRYLEHVATLQKQIAGDKVQELEAKLKELTQDGTS